MFFGVEIKQNQNQAKPMVLDYNLKLSQAVLDPAKNGKKEPVCVVAELEKKQFIICVLDPSQSWQCPLDLMFEAGEEVKFFIRGSGTVHLTGYQGMDYDDDDMEDMSLSMSESDEEADDDDVAVGQQLKRKKTLNQVPAKKIPTKASASNGKSPSSSKPTNLSKAGSKLALNGDDQDDEDDDSSDEDFDGMKDSDESDDDLDSEEMDEDDDDEDDDDDDEVDIDEEESDDE